MGREGTWVDQPTDEPVNVARWKADEEFGVYPEGARDKSLLISPEPKPHLFLIPSHRYLFKKSFERYPEQFWAEIIAYRVGCLIKAPVPPAFVGWDSDNGVCGALVEWFLEYPGDPAERYVPGGDIMTDMIKGFDRRRGRQHNFVSIERYSTVSRRSGKLDGDWLLWWCDTLLLDALVGNTDRHQDNWGLLWRDSERARMAPAFDNGTSLGHELVNRKLAGFADPDRMARYIERGTHHMRWRLGDESQAQHSQLVVQLCERHPTLRERAKMRLKQFNMDTMRSIITGMTAFDVPTPLSEERAEFVSNLTETRYRKLLEALCG
ncbi:hypothetical protein [Thiohalomonas denitrificans]|uniref:hypothetical protein n=1 Tax=Thiohalomonas denitrificans TaxID=415747 RepID=UPI0026EA42DB|nr:hypothetical protein [Thiohalomonas denitrificans]